MRSISAIVFGVIVAIEIFIFATLPPPTVTVETMPSGPGFAKYNQVTKTETIDKDALTVQNIRYGMIIIATMAIGAVITYCLPPHKEKPSE